MKDYMWEKLDGKYWYTNKGFEATIENTWDKKFRLRVAKDTVDLDYEFSTLKKAKLVAEIFIANA
jgi:hypothetical protein